MSKATKTHTTATVIDFTKLAAAIEDTKAGLRFYRNPPDQSHLDDLLLRLREQSYRAETAEEHAEIARFEAEALSGPFFNSQARGVA